MSEKPFRWRFRELTPDEMLQDATEAEFFKQDEELPAAVVRELIQNSLDAALKATTPVVVRFSFSGHKHALPPKRARYWFSSLEQYLEFAGKCPEGFLSEPMPFLTIEDSGTRGLEGDPRQRWDTEDKNDFYMFWRNVGRSAKGEDKRGRWGLGKAVNHEASEVSSFFGITHRATDGELLLMGRSVLRFPVKKDKAYDPRGWFGRQDTTNGRGPQTMPVQDEDIVHEFCADFHLTRKESSGLSLVIPLPKASLTPEAVIEAVVKNYFHAVLTGKLQVHVSSLGKKETVVDASSIDRIARQFVPKEAQGLKKLFALARWGHGLAKEERVLLQEVGQRQPEWTSEVFAPALDLREELHARFQAGNQLAFRLPIAVRRKQTDSVQVSIADVYLERVGGANPLSGDEARGRTVFVREGMTVPMTRLTHERSVRALLVVDTQPLSALLGDAENPMHTDWLANADKLAERNKNGPATVSFVKNAVREITRWLNELEDQEREDLLSDLFFIDEPGSDTGEEEVQEEKPKKKKRRKPEKDPLKPPTSPKAPPPYRISPIEGGFEVTAAEGVPPPKRLKIRAAYDARDSNPFEAYRPHDFVIDSGDLKVDATGADYMADLNSLVITVKKKDFRVTVTGFDNRRDLRVEGRKDTGDEA